MDVRNAPVPSGHAFLTEIFSGIQGEGLYVGVRQVFVRFGGCDLRCAWCDTPGSLVRRGPGRYESNPGSREFDEAPNPIRLEDAWVLLARLDPQDHHSVTFTGGEPLLQPEAVSALANRVRSAGGRTYLETHGGRVEELRSVIRELDHVSMDLKLPSSSDEFVPLSVHQEFLEVAKQADVFIKIVVTPSTLVGEIEAAASMVAGTRPGTTLVLQPVTPAGRIKEAPPPGMMLDLQRRCVGLLLDVRVIPQTHKFMGQL